MSQRLNSTNLLKPHASSTSLNLHRSRTLSIDPDAVTNARDDLQDSKRSLELSATPTLADEQRPAHQRLVIIDPVALRYIEEDVSTNLLARRVTLQGYEMYMVEQWVCSRSHPTFVICTYTGDASRSITVSVLSVPSDERIWSPRLKIYFDALRQNYNKEKETPLGLLAVTNLSMFPTSLNTMLIPDGNPTSYRLRGVLNVDLKRMSASGRAAINLQPPQPSTVSRFRQLYRVVESIPIEQSVIEVVRLVQIALSICNLYSLTICDGLLCDITERAVTRWWVEIGSFFYNIQPKDGILGPTSVAAILGLTVGAHSRLKAYGVSAGKDPLDPSAMKRAVGQFQKSSKIDKTKYLDRITLDKLHRVTAKSASGEGRIVGKAVKSTVAELGGKGGEMMMGMVGGREKVTISDVETLDIARMAQLVNGPKLKWIWQGKPMKTSEAIFLHDSPDVVRNFIKDEQGQIIAPYGPSIPSTRELNAEPSEGFLRRAETGQSHQTLEPRSGFGRLRDAVGGMKPTNTKANKDEDSDLEPLERTSTGGTGPSVSRYDSTDHILKAPPHMKVTLDLALAEASAKPQSDSRRQLKASVDHQHSGSHSRSHSPSRHQDVIKSPDQLDLPRQHKIQSEMATIRDELLNASRYEEFNSILRYKGPASKALRRSQSAVALQNFTIDDPRQNRVHHRLSFSIVDNTILTYSDPVTSDVRLHNVPADELAQAVSAREALLMTIQHRAKQVFHLQRAILPFTEGNIIYVEDLTRDLQKQLDQLNDVYYHQLDQYQTLREQSQMNMAQEKGTLEDSLRRIEMLGAKLDYELGALQSRVQEVEDGVNDFERSVQQIEARVQELTGDKAQVKQPWMQWLLGRFRARRASMGSFS